MSLFSGLASSFSQYIDLPSLSLDWLVVLNFCYFPILSIGNQNHSQRRRSREAVSGWWVSNWLIEIHTHIYIYICTHTYSSNMFPVHTLTATSISPRLHFVHLLRAMRLPEGFQLIRSGKQGMVGPRVMFLRGVKGNQEFGLMLLLGGNSLIPFWLREIGRCSILQVSKSWNSGKTWWSEIIWEISGGTQFWSKHMSPKRSSLKRSWPW